MGGSVAVAWGIVGLGGILQDRGRLITSDGVAFSSDTFNSSKEVEEGQSNEVKICDDNTGSGSFSMGCNGDEELSGVSINNDLWRCLLAEHEGE